MSAYPEHIKEILGARSPSGRARGEHGVEGADASFECGCFVRVSLEIDDNDVIESAAFASNGCGYMCAAAQVLCENVDAKSLATLNGLTHETLADLLNARLGAIPENRNACIVAASGALKAAFSELRRKRIEEFTGEKALICTCFGISEDAINQFLKTNREADLDEVIDRCRAGAGCGSCRPLIIELIDLSRQEADREAELPARS